MSESPDSEQGTAKFCPCDRAGAAVHVPSFVSGNYFCESQNAVYPTSGTARLRLYSEDKLWDGKGCLDTSNCCEQNRPPYFVTTLGASTSEDIVASLCLRDTAANSNIAVEVIELYVHE